MLKHIYQTKLDTTNKKIELLIMKTNHNFL